MRAPKMEDFRAYSPGPTPKLTAADKAEIIRLFTIEHWSPALIAPLARKSRQTIWKVLRSAGVATDKPSACWVDTACRWCERIIKVPRARFRNSAHGIFCSSDCYYVFVRGEKVCLESRSGQRHSRGFVEYYYGPLPEGGIVHHADKDCYNTHPINLILLANQRDHIRWHRGLQHLVTPLWVGAQDWMRLPWPPE